MIIEKIHIYGFGKWNNVTFDMHSSLTVIKGHNESGKTSIKQFMLYVLFDLPLSVKKQYEPKDGSRLGGRVFLRDEEKGSIIVERSMDRNKGKAICIVNGEELGEEFLKSMLNGVDRHTFENIFAFDDQELQKLTTLKGDELGKVLFGIGLSGSDHIAKLDNSLSRKMEEWFKKKGKKPIINDQIRKINDLQKQIVQLEEQQEEYNNLVEKRDSLAVKLNDIKLEIEIKVRDMSDTEKYLQAKEAIQNYQLINKKLTELADSEAFPEMGLERHQQLKEFILPINSEHHATKSKLPKLEADIQKVKELLLPDDVYEQLQKIDELAQDYYVLEKQREEKKREIEKLSLSLDEERKQLGFDKSISLHTNPLTVFTEENWKSLAKSKERIHEEEQKLSTEINGLQNDLARYKEKIQQEETKLLNDETYLQIKEQMDLHQQSKWKEQFIQEQQMQQKSNQQKLAKTVRSLGQASLIIGIVTLLIASIYSYFSNRIEGYLFGGLLFLLGFVLRFVLIKNSKAINEQIQVDRETERPSIGMNEYEALQSKFMKHEEAKRSIDEWKLKLEETNRILLHCQEKQQQLVNRNEQLRDKIAKEEENYPFLQHVSVEYWPAFYHKVVALKKKEQELEERKDAQGNLRLKANEHKRIGYHLLEACNVELNKREDIWTLLIHRKSNESKNRESYRRLQEEKEMLLETLTKIEDRLNPYLTEKNELYRLANVEDEEAFLQKGKRFMDRRDLLGKQQEWLQHVQFIFDEDVKVIVTNEWNWDELFAKKERFREEIEQLEDKRNNHMQQLADCKAHLTNLEENEQLSELRHQFAILKSELKEQVMQWMTYKAAYSFLAKTKEVYQKEYLPEIVNRASYYFERLTEGRYRQVMLPTNDESIRVESTDHVIYDVIQLSTGTIAQCYVALRLALSEVMNHSYGVPFLIDDAFVHFDGIRKQEMLNVLEQVSGKQQVIYFTCLDSQFDRDVNWEELSLEENTKIFVG